MGGPEAWVLSGSMLGWGDDVVPLDCPVLRLNSCRPAAELRDALLAWEPAGSGH